MSSLGDLSGVTGAAEGVANSAHDFFNPSDPPSNPRRKLLRVGILLLTQLSLAIPANSGHAESLSQYEHFDGFFFLSGESFYDLCTRHNEVSQQLCQAYICGTSDALAAQNILDHTIIYFNLPKAQGKLRRTS